MLWGKSNEILESRIQMRILNWKILFEQLYSTVLYRAAVLYRTVQSSCTVPYCTEQLYCAVLYRKAALYCTQSMCLTILHCIVLYCIVPYCTVQRICSALCCTEYMYCTVQLYRVALQSSCIIQY